jgi:tRNA threonylcarbamoyladenosine biosynthesis protein TsaE
MNRELTRYLADEAATLAFGGQLARLLSAGCVIYLHGELGAGKTTLVRGLLQGLGYEGRVKSPTYTLVESYEFDPVPVFHFDLYRLADPEELEYLGMRDYFSGSSVLLIEWPERGGEVLPAADIDINLAYEQRGRRLVCRANTSTGMAFLEALNDNNH